MKKPANRRGLFITFEGIDGSGKTSQIRRLAAWLRRRKVPVVVTREPGGTRAGDAIRRLFLGPRGRGLEPWAELFLIEAARAQHLAEVVRPALAAGKVVLCDRFTDSTIAYQGYGRGLPLEVIERLHELPALLPSPDLTLLFDLPVREGLERARARNAPLARGGAPGRRSRPPDRIAGRSRHGSAAPEGGGGRQGPISETRIDDEPAIFHNKVSRGYRAIAKAQPLRVVSMAANLPPDAIQDRLRSIVGARAGVRL